MTPGSREAAALRVRQSVERRAEFNQAIGVLRCWRQCTSSEARVEMGRRSRQAGDRDVATARVMAAVNEDADGRADPDLS